jgi:putative glutamine amidotransferase
MSSSQRPIIGLTSSLLNTAFGTKAFQVGQAYVNAIQKAGGIPLIVPTGTEQVQVMLTRLDGVLFTGGGDIDPKYYNGSKHHRIYGVSPERDALEFALLEATLTAGKPILAICRGIQVLNVAFGGDLYAHIPDQVHNALKHDWYPNYPRDRLAHNISITPGRILHKVFDMDNIHVNSLHHQGIHNVGNGLKATAFAPDGLVEGLEIEDANFVLGVQWHPECMPNDRGMQNLFKTFITACFT